MKKWIEKKIENATYIFSEKNFSTDPLVQLHILHIFIHARRNILISFGNYRQSMICEKIGEVCSRLQALENGLQNDI